MWTFSEILARVVVTRGACVDIETCRTCGALGGLDVIEADDGWRMYVSRARVVVTCPACTLLADALMDLALPMDGSHAP
jgi:hypothetical protein